MLMLPSTNRTWISIFTPKLPMIASTSETDYVRKSILTENEFKMKNSVNNESEHLVEIRIPLLA